MYEEQPLLIVKDYIWYARNEKTISQWCAEHLSSFVQSGLVLRFIDENERLKFLMKWL